MIQAKSICVRFVLIASCILQIPILLLSILHDCIVTPWGKVCSYTFLIDVDDTTVTKAPEATQSPQKVSQVATLFNLKTKVSIAMVQDKIVLLIDYENSCQNFVRYIFDAQKACEDSQYVFIIVTKKKPWYESGETIPTNFIWDKADSSLPAKEQADIHIEFLYHKVAPFAATVCIVHGGDHRWAKGTTSWMRKQDFVFRCSSKKDAAALEWSKIQSLLRSHRLNQVYSAGWVLQNDAQTLVL